jgi:hypothetical protein
MKAKLILIFVVLVNLLLTSCVDNALSDAPTNDNPPVGSLMFHLHTYLEDQEVDLYTIDYTLKSGRVMSLTLAQIYISEIQLVRFDNTTYDIPLKKILKVFEADSYLAGNIPVGNYKTIRFKIGLDASTNTLEPKSSADSIILNKSEMWFSNTAQPDGYVFMNVQGKIDTTTNLSGTKIPFCYKIGTNANYVQINMPDKTYTITKDQVFYQHIYIDYSKLFTDVKFNIESNLSVKTPLDNSSSIAQKIKNNMSTMFIYEN